MSRSLINSKSATTSPATGCDLDILSGGGTFCRNLSRRFEMKTEKELWWDRAEDVVLAGYRLQSLALRIEKEKPDAAKSLRSGAMCIRLVISCRFGDVIRLLDPHREATPSDVMTACETVLSGDRPKVAEEPLVKLGQGDMVREILEGDLVNEIKAGSWMHRAVAAWRSMRGVA